MNQLPRLDRASPAIGAHDARGPLIAGLAAQIHAALGPLVPTAGKPFALVGFPDYPNVGDSAIWAGQIAYFRRHHATAPAIVARLGFGDEFRTLLDRTIGPDAPVFICGGGNFGDVWARFHEQRLAALHILRGRRVVQLPQSIHFENPAEVARTAEAIRTHGDVVLLLRDQPTFDLARRAFPCEARLCPDMAFCLGALERRSVPRQDVQVLARSDHEAMPTPGAAAASPNPSVDWATEPPTLRRKALAGSLLASPLELGPARMFQREAQRELFYRQLADARLERGLAMLSEGRVVATDRLHAHILSLLLGIPHAVADNSYGKIARFMDAWGTDAVGVRRTTSLAEAVEAAREMAQ